MKPSRSIRTEPEPKTLHPVTLVGEHPESPVVDLESSETLTAALGVVNPDQKPVEAGRIESGRQRRSEDGRLDPPFFQRAG